MRLLGLLAIAIAASGCFGGFYYDGSAVWSQPGLYDVLSSSGSRAGYRFGTSGPEPDSIPHDAKHHAQLGTHSLLWLAWGPNRDFTDRMCVSPTGAFVVANRPGDDTSHEHGLFHGFFRAPAELDSWAKSFADRVVASEGDRAMVAERLMRDRTFGYSGPLLVDAVLAQLEQDGLRTVHRSGVGGYVTWIARDWCVLFDVGVKTVQKEGFTLRVDPWGNTTFGHQGRSSADDEEMATRLNATFEDLGLGRPALTVWRFSHHHGD